MNAPEWIENYAGQLCGDDTYVSDGSILLKKEELYNSYEDWYVKILQKIKTHKKLPLECLPYEVGKIVDMSNKAQLYPGHRILVNFEDFLYDYKYIELAHSLLDIAYYTIAVGTGYIGSEKTVTRILKFWNEQDEFIGSLMEVKL